MRPADDPAHPPRMRVAPFRAKWNRSRALADEFSQFSRFPAAQPVSSDINEIVHNALDCVRRPPGWHRSARRTGAWPSASASGSRAVQARGRQPGGQCRRSHAGFARQAACCSSRSPSSHDSVELLVADTGCGISAGKTRKNYSCPIFQLKAAARAWDWPSSTIFCPNMARAFASKIIVPPARASTWRFQLTVAAEAEAARVKNTRVLIVDDEPGIRESLRGVLEDEGFFCAAVESGEQCLEELARAELRSRAAGRLAARHGRHGDAGAHPGDSLRGPPGSGDHLRPRHHRNRRKSHQAGGLRFPREAADHRESHGRAEQRRAAAPAGTGAAPPEGIGRREAPASSARACP